MLLYSLSYYLAFLGSKIVEEADKERLYKNRVEAGEKRCRGACKHCFQYLIEVHQLLVSPMIGQL